MILNWKLIDSKIIEYGGDAKFCKDAGICPERLNKYRRGERMYYVTKLKIAEQLELPLIDILLSAAEHEAREMQVAQLNTLFNEIAEWETENLEELKNKYTFLFQSYMDQFGNIELPEASNDDKPNDNPNGSLRSNMGVKRDDDSE